MKINLLLKLIPALLLVLGLFTGCGGDGHEGHDHDGNSSDHSHD